jgi:predicted deacylase
VLAWLAAGVLAAYAAAALCSARGSALASSAYPSPDEAEAELDAIARVRPELCRIEEIGKSTQGRPLRALMACGEGARGLADSERPRLLLTAHIHAVEFVGGYVARDLARRLVRGYGRDRTVTSVLDRAEVCVVPCLNPDGAQRVWRRGGFCGLRGARHTANGVDPNRNFPFVEREGRRAWNSARGRRRSAYYRGPAPLSEPECRALAQLARRLRFCGAVHFHSFGGVVYLPALDAPDPPAGVSLDAARHALEVFQGPFQSRQSERRYRPVPERSAAIEGQLDAFLLGAFGTPSVTVEVGRPDLRALLPGRLGNVFWVANPPDPARWARNDAPAAIYALRLLLERTGGYPCAPTAPALSEAVPS